MSIEWFKQFGDIPGVSYITPDDIDRSELSGASRHAEVITPAGRQVLSWSSPLGMPSGCPARRPLPADTSKLSTTEKYGTEEHGAPLVIGSPSFGILISLYEREGAPLDALEVAELAAELEPSYRAARDQVVARLAALAEEAW